MKKKRLLSILGMLMLFSMFSLVAAQPPFETNVNTISGLQIFYPQFEWAPQDMNFNLHVHVSNISNGVQFPNDEVSCYIHLYNTTGDHTYESNEMGKDSNGWDHEIELTSGNFSDLGYHAFYIWCNNTAEGLGGEVKGTFEVNPTGTEFTISEAILYGFLLLLLGLFLYLGLYGIRKAVSVEWLIGYICLSYIILYLIISIIWILSANYLWAFPMLGNVLFIIWLIMGFGFLPFIIVVSLVMLGKEATAALEQGYIKQGYSPEEARELSRKNKR